MKPIQVKFKKLSRAAQQPTKADDGSAGWDLYIANMQPILKRGNFYTRVIELGISTEFPKEWGMLIVPRSGSGFKHQLKLANGTAVIDSSYRGEILLKVVTPMESGKDFLEELRTGDRIAQALFIPVPAVDWIEEEILSQSERGEGGFGHSGR